MGSPHLLSLNRRSFSVDADEEEICCSCVSAVVTGGMMVAVRAQVTIRDISKHGTLTKLIKGALSGIEIRSVGCPVCKPNLPDTWPRCMCSATWLYGS